MTPTVALARERDEARRLARNMVGRPMGMMLGLLEACPESSLEIEEKSGVAASVVRAVRNGQTTTMKVDTWGALLTYLLASRYDWVTKS